jgi:uncharacterized protein YndB with AHSA1/START domain
MQDKEKYMKESGVNRRELIKLGAAAAVAAAATATTVGTVGCGTHSNAFPEPAINLSGQAGTIVQTNTFDATVDKVWAALTDPVHLDNWFSKQSTVVPGVGGSMRHSWGDPVIEESTIQIWEPNARLKVVEVIPFGVTFQPADGGSKQRTIDYTLKASGSQTIMTMEHTGFGTTPEWQKFQSAVAGCENFQASALGHYVSLHFAETRTVSWARVPSAKSYGEMWSMLNGPDGILAQGSLQGLQAGDRYSIRTVTGDVFEGVVVSHIPSKQFAGTVENMNNSLLRIVLDNCGTNEAGIWLASWGAQPAANQVFEWRWVHTLQNVLSKGAVTLS